MVTLALLGGGASLAGVLRGWSWLGGLAGGLLLALAGGSAWEGEAGFAELFDACFFGEFAFGGEGVCGGAEGGESEFGWVAVFLEGDVVLCGAVLAYTGMRRRGRDWSKSR